MQQLQRACKCPLVIVALAAGIAITAMVFPLCRALSERRAPVVQGRIQQVWCRVLLAALRVRVRTTGRMADDAPLWVANHISWLDILVLGAQRPTQFVAKHEVGTWPIIGYMARRNGTMLLRRGDAVSSRRIAEDMAWRLRRQQGIALFPEGTSSDGTVVRRFHSRLLQGTFLTGTRVQAVGLAYPGRGCGAVPFVGEDSFLPSLWRILAEPVIDVELHFREPLSPHRHTRDTLAELTRQQIVEALGLDNVANARLTRKSG